MQNQSNSSTFLNSSVAGLWALILHGCLVVISAGGKKKYLGCWVSKTDNPLFFSAIPIFFHSIDSLENDTDKGETWEKNRMQAQ